MSTTTASEADKMKNPIQFNSFQKKNELKMKKKIFYETKSIYSNV